METKKLKLRWRLFTFSSLFLVILSVVAVSRPLGDSTLDEISIALPFFTLYYILMGFHMLGKYEEKTLSEEKNGGGSIRSQL